MVGREAWTHLESVVLRGGGSAWAVRHGVGGGVVPGGCTDGCQYTRGFEEKAHYMQARLATGPGYVGGREATRALVVEHLLVELPFCVGGYGPGR